MSTSADPPTAPEAASAGAETAPTGGLISPETAAALAEAPSCAPPMVTNTAATINFAPPAAPAAAEAIPPILDASAATAPWAIAASALPLAVGAEAPAAAPTAPGRHGPRAGQVAVIRAAGIVVPRCQPVLEQYGYAVSCEALPGRLEAAAAEGAAAIVLQINSPGGLVYGVPEAAKRIAAVAKDVPVVAVADHLAASAAYWLAASCTAVACSPSGQVGSVGVLAVRLSLARMADMDGIDIDVFYRGTGKTDSLWLVALDDAGRKRLQAPIDAYYASFVAAVAAGRHTTARTVEKNWGARVLTADAALDAGMIDVAATANEVAERLATSRGRRAFRSMAIDRAIVSRVRAHLAPARSPTGDPDAAD